MLIAQVSLALKKMKLLIFLVVAYVSGSYAASLPFPANELLAGNRIVGGEVATIEEHPYQISLEYGTGHRCGGSILDESTILTAAHCTSGLSTIYFYVRAGTSNVGSGGQRVRVSSVIEHSGYNSVTVDNDIAILKLATPLTFNDAVQPVQLISAERALEAGYPSVVSGWGVTYEGGTTAEPVLRHVELAIVAHATCRSNYFLVNTVTDRMICAAVSGGGKDACQGDSGGPLVVDSNVQVGIVSWGLGCARPNYPGVYASVQAFLDWIAENSA